MKPALDELDQQRTVPGKEKPLYTSEELESVLLFQRICGYSSYKRARDHIAGDRGDARKELGFEKRRNRGRRVVTLRDGVPSEATVSRHRARLPEWRRDELYDALEQALLAQHLEDEDFQEEARVLYVDGTTVLTHYQAPIVDPDTGRVVNDARMTAPEAGFVGRDGGPDKAGHGWSAVQMVTRTGIPVAREIRALNVSEKDVVMDVVSQYGERVAPHLRSDGLSVLSADGGFSKPELREELRQLGIVESIHLVSHGHAPESRTNAAKNDAKRIPISGYKSWYTNGHRELVCACGAGTTFRRFDKDRHGRAIARVEGSCKKCGSVTVTSGDWRLAQNPSRWVRVNPKNQHEKRDWLMGNPLTYNDPLASEYGRQRWGRQEGFHGAQQKRFGLIKEKRWFRRLHQVRIEFTMTSCVMHVLATEQRRLARERAAQAPPALAA